MDQVITQDLYKEHSQHTSDDWANLKDKCSECYKAISSLKNIISRGEREWVNCPCLECRGEKHA